MAAMEASAQLTRRTVVGSFIFKHLSVKDTASPVCVALFRRSADVSTYKHKLAPISGTLEPTDASPLAAAWREIREETRLSPRSLSLRRQGKPYTFVDEALKREWTIYPFAFDYFAADKVGTGDEITTDWEHEGWDWYDPRSVTDDESFGGVPNLTKSLRRSWFEYDLGDGAGGILARGLHAMQSDHLQGAALVALRAMGVLADVMIALEWENKEVWWRNARMAAWHLVKNGRESMGASILNHILRLLTDVEKEILENWDENQQWQREMAVYDILARNGGDRQPVQEAVSRNFGRLLEARCDHTRPVRILTLSGSSTLERCFRDAVNFSGFTFDIRVLESRPLYEGATMAADIARTMDGLSGIEGPDDNRVTVYTDAQAAIAAQDVDFVVIGADIIGAEGAVCNKVGTLPALLAARHVSPDAKVVVAASKDKVWHYPRPEMEENDRAEVVDSWRALESAEGATKVIRHRPGRAGAGGARNFYFEWVEPGMVDCYVTEEEGGMDEVEMKRLAEEVERKEKHFFGEL